MPVSRCHSDAMRSGITVQRQERGAGYGQSPAWPRRWISGLSAASCCLLMLVAIDANLSALVQSVPQYETSSLKLLTPSPAVPVDRVLESPQAAQEKKPVIKEQAPSKAQTRPLPQSLPQSLPILAPKAILPAPSLQSHARPSPEPSVPAPPKVTDDKKTSALAAYQNRLWARIAARKPIGVHISGTAMVRFIIGRGGELVSAELAATSGNAALDRLALRTVRNASPFPAPPADVEGDRLTFTVPFSFH